MMWLLLAAHVAMVGVLAMVGDRLGRRAFILAALPAALTAGWGAGRLGNDGVSRGEVTWVEGLDLDFAFAVGPLATVLTVIVSGIGVLVFSYAGGYFSSAA